MKNILLVLSLLAFILIGAMMPRAGEAQTSAGPPPSPSPSPSPTAENVDSVKEYLLNSSAADFDKFQPPYPAKFRNVRLGHAGDTSKSGAWRLCGEFLPTEGGDKAEWTAFATVKTSGYEQYIGPTIYCTDSKIVWDTTDDLATILKNKLDSMKKK